jgi:3-isopropylmalate/(R)-2-methylmalate dehydratase small subunit
VNLVIQGRVWVFGDAINTDAMYPGFAMKLSIAEAAEHVFHELRPGWTSEVRPGDIVIAGRNFGVGSSRPVAALFQELQIAALVADEFNSLFLRNAINAGLPALTVAGIGEHFGDGDEGRFNIATGDWANQTTGVAGQTAPLPELVIDILCSGGLLPRLAAQGYFPQD